MPDAFAQTRWSLIQQTSSKNTSAQRNQAWEEFYELYKAPLLKFIKLSGFSQNDAEDILQNFLLKLSDEKGLDQADKEKGKMRTFLTFRLKRHIQDQFKLNYAKKRGSGVKDLHIDEVESHLTSDADESKKFDQQWAKTLVLLALKKLKEECKKKEKLTEYEVLAGQITGGSEMAQKEAAKKLNISTDAVRMKVSRLRKKFQQLLELEVAQTLSEGEDVHQEMLYLAHVLAQENQ